MGTKKEETAVQCFFGSACEHLCAIRGSIMCMIEVNFVRLLHHTEDLASDERAHEIRFGNYLDALKQFYQNLLTSNKRPTGEYVRHYESRLKRLEHARVVKFATSGEERASLLTSPALPLIPRPVEDDQLLVTASSSIDPKKQDTESSSSIKVNGGPAAVYGHLEATPDLLRKQREKIARENRELLLGSAQDASTSDYSTQVDSTASPEKKRLTRSNLINQEEMRRETLVSEMLGMAKHLRDQSAAMNERLQSDRDLVVTSATLADRNRAELEKSMRQLSEELGSRCARFVWIALFLAVVIFFQLILCMKVFGKRTRGIVSKSSRSEL